MMKQGFQGSVPAVLRGQWTGRDDLNPRPQQCHRVKTFQKDQVPHFLLYIFFGCSFHIGDYFLAISNNLKNIEINGRQLHYVDQGGEGRQTPAIIFIHGGLDDYRCWQFQIDFFSEKKYRTISYSRRFAYPNKWIGNVAQDNTIEENAKDLAELIKKLQLVPAHLVGASYGAFTALYCASKHPELAKTMVLNEPPIMEFLARSHLKEDVELRQTFRTRVLIPTQDASRAGDFRKAAQVAIDGIMGIDNYFGQLPEEGKQFLIDNAKSLASELNLQSRCPTLLKMSNR